MDSDRNDLYKRLLQTGTSESEIERVYNQLRSKGYGDEVARARVEKAVQRVHEENRRARAEKKQQKKQSGGRSGGDEHSSGAATGGGTAAQRGSSRGAQGDAATPGGQGGTGTPLGASDSSRTNSAHSAEGAIARESGPEGMPQAGSDASPQELGAVYARRPSPAIRRRVNAWAFRERLLITGIRERLSDFLSLVAPGVPDYANPRLVQRIAGSVQFKAVNPFDYSLYETLWALKSSAAVLLGAQESATLPCPAFERVPRNEVVTSLRRREPFLVAFFTPFVELSSEAIEELRFFGESYRAGRRVRVQELTQAARTVTRLQLATEQVTDASLRDLLQTGEDVLQAYGGFDPGQINSARELFLASRAALGDFARELYPVVLKALNTFYAPEDRTEQKRSRLLGFCRLGEDDVLTISGFRSRQIREKEQKLIAEQSKEIEQLEDEKEEELQDRYQGVLGMLEALFPGAGWDRIEKRPYLLPYFDQRVFNRQLPFPQRSPDIQAVSREDPLQHVMVVHRLLDNLLSSLNQVHLEHVLGRTDVAERFSNLEHAWKRVYTEVFEPYVKALTEIRRAREEHDTHNAAYTRSLQEQVNQIRNRCIRDYGHTVLAGSEAAAPALYDLATELVEALEEIGTELNVDLIQREDPLGKRIYRQLESHPLIEFDAHANPAGADSKPVIRQLKRYAEAKYQNRLAAIPKLAQLFYLDFFRGLADFYAYLLTDENSPSRAAGSDVPVAGEEEARQWQREQDTRQRDTLELVHARLKEEREAGLRDTLTGLRNKDFFLQKLPELYGRLQSKQRTVSLLLLDIDHFKWVNDRFGHPKGDEVLIDVAQTVADAVRKGHDLPIRYGGEELLIMVQGNAHTALLLAERLRHAQAQRIEENELYEPIRALAESEEAPCATFSIGVLECRAGEPITDAVAAADKALYSAKEARNTVVLGRRPEGKSDPESLQFVTYDHYARSHKEEGRR